MNLKYPTHALEAALLKACQEHGLIVTDIQVSIASRLPPDYGTFTIEIMGSVVPHPSAVA